MQKIIDAADVQDATKEERTAVMHFSQFLDQRANLQEIKLKDYIDKQLSMDFLKWYKKSRKKDEKTYKLKTVEVLKNLKSFFKKAQEKGTLDSIKKLFKASPKDEPKKLDEKGEGLSKLQAREFKAEDADGGVSILDDKGYPVALFAIQKTKEPCLPNTYMVKFIAVAKQFRGKGMGSYLYDLAAVVAQSLGGEDAGITSDRADSTTKMAGALWKRIAKKYKAKETKKGNKKFDYDGKLTPKDPDDDCNEPPEGNPATDYSWLISSDLKSRAVTIYNKQKNNYENFENKLSEEQFEEEVVKLFDEAYGQGKASGIVEERLINSIKPLVREMLRKK